jgi:hypothetical protein
MANKKHVTILKRGVEQWNAWREQHLEITPDLSRADLSRADLYHADLYHADLYHADLSRADLSLALLSHADLSLVLLSDAILSRAHLSRAHLRGADLYHADLSFALLSGADLRDADLSRVALSGADLSDAILIGADLSGAILSGADLSGAILQSASVDNTVFARIDLRTVKGLAEIHHKGPSRVELYTVQLPQDGSALHFLRGCGVPDEWIDFYRSTMMHPIQYYSVFISYSSKDEQLARRLHADLQDKGVRCWFAPEDLKIGDRFRQRIDEAIHLQDKLLLLLSEHSIGSEWVEVEVEAACEKEAREKRLVLFPVRLDECVMTTGQAWAANLRRTRHIGDFTHWTDPQAYQQAFERLVRDLKKADE